MQQSINQKLREDREEAEASARDRENAVAISDIPTCDDKTTAESLKKTIESRGQMIVGLKGFSDVSSGTVFGSRVCAVDALFQSGEHKISYSVKWFDKDRDQLAISIREVE